MTKGPHRAFLSSCVGGYSAWKLEVFFPRFKSMPFDDVAAHSYGLIRAALEIAGHSIGPNDTLIAAIALANGLTVVTHQHREFRRVPGLLVEDWETVKLFYANSPASAWREIGRHVRRDALAPAVLWRADAPARKRRRP